MSDAQKVDNQGVSALYAFKPEAWVLDPPVQGTDFGYDFGVQVPIDGVMCFRFGLQLKSTRSEKNYHETAEYFSVPVSARTCSYYLRDGNPVMLVFCDLRSSPRARDAALYYLWLTEDLEAAKLGGKLAGIQSEVTFRVPKANVLDESLDVGPYLRGHVSAKDAATALQRKVSIGSLSLLAQHHPVSLAAVSRIPVPSLRTWAEGGALDGDKIWPEASAGSPLARTREVADLVSAGRIDEAASRVEQLGGVESQWPIEVQAELAFQAGRLANRAGLLAEARLHFERAESLVHAPRHLAAALESSLADSFPADAATLTSLLLRTRGLEGSECVREVRARIRALQGDRSGSEEEIAQLTGIARVKASVLSALIFNDWNRAELLAAEAELLESTSPNERLLLSILRMRARYHQLFGESEQIPVGGPIGLDVDSAKSLLCDTMAILDRAQRAGWPANSDLLLDVVGSLAPIFHRQEQARQIVEKFMVDRPKHIPGRLMAARLSSIAERPDEALAALDGMDLDHDHVARKVLLLCQIRRDMPAVELALGKLVHAPLSEISAIAVGLAAVAARRLGLTANAAQLDEVLSATSEFAGVRAFMAFQRDCIENPAAAAEHKEKLWRIYESMADDCFLQDNLLNVLSQGDKDSTTRVEEVCSRIAKRRLLAIDEFGRLAGVLCRSDRWSELRDLCASTQVRFGDLAMHAAYVAFGLDHAGQTVAAMAILERFVDGEDAEAVLGPLAEMAARSGLRDRAIGFIRKALSVPGHSRRQQFALTKVLVQLCAGEGGNVVTGLVSRLGELADPSVEEQEGTYLMLAFMNGTTSSEHSVAALQARADEFFRRFPDSDVIRRVEIPASVDGTDLMDRLRDIAGWTEEVAAAQARRWNQLESGRAALPLALLPRLFVPWIHDVASMFVICMRAPSEQTWSAMRVRCDDDVPLSQQSVESRRIVLDLVTILAITSLNLWHAFFRMWTSVAITKATLYELNRVALGNSLSEGRDLAQRSLQEIGRRAGAILQPGSRSDASEVPFFRAESDEIAQACAADDLAYCTLDRSAGVYLEVAHQVQTVSLLNVLDVGRERQVISVDGFLWRLARILTWNTLGLELAAHALARVLVHRRLVTDAEVDALGGALPVEGLFRRRWLKGATLPKDANDAGCLLIEIGRIRVDAIGFDAARELVAEWLRWMLVQASHRQSVAGLVALLLASVARNLIDDRASQDLIMGFAWRVCRAVHSDYPMVQASSGLTELDTEAARCFALLEEGVARRDPASVIGGSASVAHLLSLGYVAGTSDAEAAMRYFATKCAERQKRGAA